jgi:MoaA/NifB/PqqE/SkfB family radical SAM enzyme
MLLKSGPVLCNYYLTYRCNATCSFCDIWERPSPYAEPETVFQNLRDLKRLGVKVIDFTGGEPLLHRQIDVLLEEAKKLGFITTLTTNTLLYPKWAEKLKGQVDMLHFSLDSPIEEEHNQSRGVNCFQHLQESISIAKKLGERPDILFTVFEHNLHHLEVLWNEYALEKNLVLILNPVFEYNQVEAGQKLTEAQLQQLRAWGKKKNVFLNEAFIQLRLDGGNQISNPICKALTTTVVIGPENDLILPCYHLGLENIPIEGQLFELYHSEKVQKMKEWEGRLPACQGCTVNCYMQPSFTVNLNRYWWLSAPSALKYNWIKGTWKRLLV